MTNTKSTKRALLASVMAMLLCFTMLLGTTFAWFTDSVTSSGNKIVAGTLDIDLVDADGSSLEGRMIEWSTTDGRAQDEIFWEPGCTYETEEFYIVNNGNLNLKFQFNVTGISGDAKLLEVVDFTCLADASWFNFNADDVSVSTEGEFDLLKGYELGTQTFTEYVLEPGQKVGPIVLSGHMDENAGNEYQGLTIEGISISLIATQTTGEEDSISGTYDENAAYPEVVIVSNTEELAAALAAGSNIVLTNDVTTDNALYMNGGTLNGNGTTIDGSSYHTNTGVYKKTICAITSTGGTVENLTVYGAFRGIGTGSSGDFHSTEDLIVDNVVVDGGVYAINHAGDGYNLIVSNSTLCGWTSYTECGLATFTNCTFSQGNTSYNYLITYDDTVFKNCTFEDGFKMAANKIGFEDGSYLTIELKNCTYNGVTLTAENFEELMTDAEDTNLEDLKQCTVIVDGATVVFN